MSIITGIEFYFSLDWEKNRGHIQTTFLKRITLNYVRHHYPPCAGLQKGIQSVNENVMKANFSFL